MEPWPSPAYSTHYSSVPATPQHVRPPSIDPYSPSQISPTPQETVCSMDSGLKNSITKTYHHSAKTRSVTNGTSCSSRTPIITSSTDTLPSKIFNRLVLHSPTETYRNARFILTEANVRYYKDKRSGRMIRPIATDITIAEKGSSSPSKRRQVAATSLPFDLSLEDNSIWPGPSNLSTDGSETDIFI